MSVRTNCSECHNSFPIGRNFDWSRRVCSACAMKNRTADAQEAKKNALAEDLVRGIATGEQAEGSK